MNRVCYLYPSCSRPAKKGKRFSSRHLHIHLHIQRKRRSLREKGYGSNWPQYSRRYLRAHPFCVLCEMEGRTELAKDVDHRVPVIKGGSNDTSNLWGLCKMHHGRKTVQEQIGLDVEHWRDHEFNEDCPRCMEILIESRIL